MRSDEFLLGDANALGRSLLKGMGYSNDEIKKPKIGIANSWNEIVPGHYNLRELAGKVRAGIYAAGGTPMEFGTIALCDGIGQGNVGMKYMLPSRDVIANSIELMVEAHRLDAIVLLGSCDKIVPGMLIAAARLKIPAIFLGGGTMLGGDEFFGRKSDINSCAEAQGMMAVGEATKEEIEILEEVCAPTCGSCSFLGTANSMNCIAEALGMSLPGAALVPAVHNDRRRLAYDTGMKIVELFNNGVSAEKIITKEAILNAVKVCIAIGGSTNVVMHLIAIAKEAGIDVDVIDAFDKLSYTVPTIARVNPSTYEYNVEDFWRAGGIVRVMENLAPMLDTSVMTASGMTLRANIDTYRYKQPKNENVIRPIDEPFGDSGAVAIMRGNLCPQTAVAKPGAIDDKVRHFVGKAICFDSEEEANQAILDGKVKDGHVVVIRYEGPKGGPGMREMYRAMKYLYGRGLAKSTALITDGRFSGSNNGCFIGHISPEAQEGGPIAIIRDGDEIEIDIDARRVDLLLSEAEIAERLSRWKAPELKFKTGYLAVYSKLAASAAEGAILKI